VYKRDQEHVHLRISFLMGPTSTSIGHSGLVTAWHPVLAGQMASAMNGTTWGNASTTRSEDRGRQQERECQPGR
jgi:hypothetical protein